MSKRGKPTIRDMDRHWRVVARRFKGRHQRWMVDGIRASAKATGGTGPRDWSDHADRLMRIAMAEGFMVPMMPRRMDNFELRIDVINVDEEAPCTTTDTI